MSVVGLYAFRFGSGMRRIVIRVRQAEMAVAPDIDGLLCQPRLEFCIQIVAVVCPELVVIQNVFLAFAGSVGMCGAISMPSSRACRPVVRKTYVQDRKRCTWPDPPDAVCLSQT